MSKTHPVEIWAVCGLNRSLKKEVLKSSPIQAYCGLLHSTDPLKSFQENSLISTFHREEKLIFLPQVKFSLQRKLTQGDMAGDYLKKTTSSRCASPLPAYLAFLCQGSRLVASARECPELRGCVHPVSRNFPFSVFWQRWGEGKVTILYCHQ